MSAGFTSIKFDFSPLLLFREGRYVKLMFNVKMAVRIKPYFLGKSYLHVLYKISV